MLIDMQKQARYREVADYSNGPTTDSWPERRGCCHGPAEKPRAAARLLAEILGLR